MKITKIITNSKYTLSSNLQKILGNISWLALGKLFRIGINLIIYVLLARYLGPEQFGLLNYAMALIAMFSNIAMLGLKNIVVRDIAKDQSLSREILGTAFILHIIGGLAAFLIVIFAVYIMRPDDYLVILMVVVLGSTLIFKCSEVVKYWFASQVQSKYIVWIESGTFTVVAVIKIILVFTGAPIMAFVWAIFIEAIAVAVAHIVLYEARGYKVSEWKVHYGRAITLLKSSWPLLFSSGFALLNMNIDKVMLGQIIGDKELGIYSVAFLLSSVWYSLPIFVGISVIPYLSKLFIENEALYNKNAQKIFNVLTLSAIFASVVIVCFSDSIVELAFGREYFGSGAILSIHMWSALFVFHIAMRSRLLVIEGRQYYVFLFAGLTLAVNVIANIILIPIYAGVGAAYASLISWIAGVLIVPLLFKDTHHYPVRFFKSLLFYWVT